MAQPNVQRGGSYIPNGPMPNPAPGATPLLPNQGRILQSGSTKVLCIADVRGNLQSLNELARKNNANCIVHTGDFGFYDDSSLTRIAEKTLKHVAQYSPLLNDVTKRSIAATAPGQSVKDRFVQEKLPLSELPRFLTKELKLEVPVYTVWGACEDVQVLEKLRSKEYDIENLHLIDEAHSRLLEVGGVKLRLLGLGGAVVMHKLFDNGEGRTTIAGGQGTMWTTLLQMGELVDTANRVYDPTETRIFVTHASPAREGLLNQLSVTLKADFSISAGLHFRYGSSYNEFSVNPTLDHYRGKLAASKASFNDVWETVKSEVEPAVSENEAQQRLLQNALEIVGKMPTVANGGNPFGGPAGGHAGGQVDESAFKNMWNFNLADAAYGQLILEIEGGRIATEMKAQGFNFAHRGGKVQPQQPAPAQTAAATVPNTAAQAPNQSRQASVATPPVPASQPKASPAAPRDTPKPATPQPAASGSDKGASETRTNGTPSVETKPAEPASSPAPRFEEKKSGLFINNAADEDTAKSYLAEEDRAKITKIEGRGTNRFALLFENNEDRDAALGRVPAEHKALVATLRDQPRSGPKGFWRSGAPAGGYRSGGGSDSEGGRGGRGSFRGGRGRGGDRGRGRGRGRGGAGEAGSGGGDA